MQNSLLIVMSLILFTGCGGRTLPMAGDGADGGAGPVPGKVTVTTDTSSTGISKSVTGTVFNGTASSIWLMGCDIFSREFREKPQDKWRDRGPTMVCAWEGEAKEVKPGKTHSGSAFFHEPGTWRLTLSYGIGCKKGKPMNAGNCQELRDAVSGLVTATVDRAACEQINKQYGKALEAAKKCNPAIFMIQCHKQVAGDLACGCPLFVQDTTQLQKLRDKWDAYKCSKLIPSCGIKCVSPKPATCGKDGKCVPK